MNMNEYLNDNWSFLACGHCKFWGKDCKRIDHEQLRLSKPFFKCYDDGQFSGMTCRDFVPRDSVPWLKEHWTNFDDYYGEKADKGFVSLIVDKNESVCYYVTRKDWNDNTFLDEDGSLKWVKKMCYKVSRKSPIGYELITEYAEDNDGQ